MRNRLALRRPEAFAAIAAAVMLCAGLAARSDGGEPMTVRCDFVDNVVYLPVTVNGQGPFFMTLDTGTNPSAIDLAKAQALGLAVAPSKTQAQGFGTSSVATQRTSVATLNVGGIEARQVEFDALDLKDKLPHSDKPIIGLLGYSLISKCAFMKRHRRAMGRYFPCSWMQAYP